MDRRDVTFVSSGVRCAAWHYRPDGAGPHPCVIMAHGFGAIREMRLDAYAERFRAAGLAVLLFDYRHWGSSEGEPRHVLDIAMQQDDWRAAVAFARGLEGVDPDRVALFGSSFSGGHVLELAAEDPGVAAVVAQCPFVDGLATTRVLPPRSLALVLAAGLLDELRARRGRPPHYTAIAGPPGSRAALASPDSEAGVRALLPPGAPWENKHTPRVALRLGLYRPIRKARRIRCPLLVCACERDLLTPLEPAAKVADRAPRGGLRRYPIGHFDIYFGEWFERAVADQVDFLTRELRPGTTAGAPAGEGAAAAAS